VNEGLSERVKSVPIRACWRDRRQTGGMHVAPQHALSIARPDGLERVQPDTDPDKIVEILHRDGGLVIEELLDPGAVARLDAELEPFATARRPGFKAEHDDSFYGSRTVRIQGLAAKSPTFVTDYLLHPTLLAVADRVLLPNCGDYWLSQAETIFIHPGNPAQELHRDDCNWGVAQRLGIDLQISVLLALGDYDAEVGATRVVPGSHRRPLDEHIDPADAKPVEMEPGSALVYTGSLVHGGGANRTTDRVRKGLYLAFLQGWLTPEEAVAVGVGPDLAATLPERARELLGWANLRSPADAEDPAAAALQLWQLDADDLDRLGRSFHHR
jgi:ectoine hydroxylase-related dioxygenase (phytanoyl-CoA dioxygenase family)